LGNPVNEQATYPVIDKRRNSIASVTIDVGTTKKRPHKNGIQKRSTKMNPVSEAKKAVQKIAGGSCSLP
jgi:hypothetical protein